LILDLDPGRFVKFPESSQIWTAHRYRYRNRYRYRKNGVERLVRNIDPDTDSDSDSEWI
jgi:hypothetical protein